MAERTDQLTEARSADHELDLEEPPSRTGRVRKRAGTLFSPKRFLFALALIVAGTLVGGVVPVAGGIIGAFVGAFLVGVASRHRPMIETGVAGAAVVGLSTAFDYLPWLVGGNGRTIAALGLAVGFVVCTLGAYFGADLRDGLTREI
ncbi:hypothetical protein [Halalkalicoccus jeotgali]|uniref:Uncharacterized protein n=1 Tax=Halalkalicoccus jeotgali (strain DSM 18796 / CECT 7217 / JCM 14584 / KCTC 4019 / B3) TaxID=795797 RepID=D8JAF4_HALJB|nr:hypothetical protein [Halalkalicoccus jeotgali]ADJ14676.1 hypothetical protein HacjB3_06425 [Halalkalicoccus jeotgali B3]ELY39574.1 hypothetical protein C497_04822 [Halalkalicoccus jeotgali B3]